MLMKYTAQKTENAVRPNLEAMLYFNPVSLWTGTRIICSPIGITEMRVRYDTYIYNVYRPSCVILYSSSPMFELRMRLRKVNVM